MVIPSSFTISTERLLLKQVSEEDIPFVFDATRYEGFNDGMLWDPPSNPAELKLPLERSLDAWSNGEGYAFSLWNRTENTRVIGRIAIRKMGPGMTWNMGFWTHPQEQGNGYMTEAARAVLDFGFERLEAEEIEAFHATWNKASERVLEKVGMSRREFVEKGFMKKGNWIAEYRMSIFRDDWWKARRCTE